MGGWIRSVMRQIRRQPRGTVFKVGDRVDSTYGVEHRGTIVDVGEFPGLGTFYRVRRDADGFVWVGWDETVVLVDK